MKKFNPILLAVSLAIILVATALLYIQAHPTLSSVSSSPFPSPSVTPAPSAPPTPGLQTYSDSTLGISFRYPAGYFATDDPKNGAISISNSANLPSGNTPAEYRVVGISYDSSAAAYENVVPGLAGSQEIEFPVSGGTVRFYTYKNPSQSERTLAMAFFSGRYSFSASIGWNAYDASAAEADRESGEVALLRLILPTLVISK